MRLGLRLFSRGLLLGLHGGLGGIGQRHLGVSALGRVSGILGLGFSALGRVSSILGLGGGELDARQILFSLGGHGGEFLFADFLGFGGFALIAFVLFLGRLGILLARFTGGFLEHFFKAAFRRRFFGCRHKARDGILRLRGGFGLKNSYGIHGVVGAGGFTPGAGILFMRLVMISLYNGTSAASPSTRKLMMRAWLAGVTN